MTELLELGGLIENLFLGITGSPFMVGLLLFLTVIGFIAVMRIGLEGGIAIGIPTSFLVFEYIPEAKLLFGILWGIILGMGFLKIMNK